MEIQEGFVTTGLSTVEGGSPDTTADTGDPGSDQGTSDEGQTGTETTESETTYGGFKTVEELIADHEAKVKRVEELDGLRGRLGAELGTIRTEKERLAGMLEAYKTQTVPASQTGTDFAELEKKFNDGEITIGQLLQERDKLIHQNVQNIVNEKVKGFKSEIEFNQYRDNFIKENPGYLEAFSAGKLSQWIDRGFSGEQAWDKFQLQEAKREKDELQKKITTKTEAARKDGINTGVKIEQGKGPTSKVLGSDGASFGQGKTNQPILSHKDRIAAARDILRRMNTT